ncbi:hypothetical protein AURDEDRAFT_173701 [Auricularia subglabra TFB-10046 SS5]|nr:hypothetical protein AURDEDRAFT_173701 [Auricularia subglabra TFB-10046 SS5]
MLIPLLDVSLARGLRDPDEPVLQVPFAPLLDVLRQLERPVEALFDRQDARTARPVCPPVVAMPQFIVNACFPGLVPALGQFNLKDAEPSGQERIVIGLLKVAVGVWGAASSLQWLEHKARLGGAPTALIQPAYP